MQCTVIVYLDNQLVTCRSEATIAGVIEALNATYGSEALISRDVAGTVCDWGVLYHYVYFHR